ncbi:MAG: hypothetical protein AB7G75_28980 [Candidatus Binatia bacterium]
MATTDSLAVNFSSPLSAPPPAVAERVRKHPECHLLWAVLTNGIDEYMKYVNATNRRGKRLFREAETWIMADDPTRLCSFVSLCHVLGLDPDYIRTGLRRWRSAHEAESLLRAA